MSYKIIQFPMVQDPPIIIPDISKYNANRNTNPVRHFDFDKFKAKGGKVIVLRGAVHSAGLDYEFAYNVEACVQRDIFFMLYHPVRLWEPLDIQVNHIKMATDHAKEVSTYRYLRSYYDLEVNIGLSPSAFTYNFFSLDRKVIDTTDELFGTYTRASFWNQNAERNNSFNHNPLWVAHHFLGIDPYKVPTARPYIPEDWYVEPDMWQFDTHDSGQEWGNPQGAEDEIDLSWFTYKGGTYAAFEERYGVKLNGQDPPPPPPAARNFMVDPARCAWLNGRAEPRVVSDNRYLVLRSGQVGTLVGEANGWKKLRFDQVEAWMSEAYLKEVT